MFPDFWIRMSLWKVQKLMPFFLLIKFMFFQKLPVSILKSLKSSFCFIIHNILSSGVQVMLIRFHSMCPCRIQIHPTQVLFRLREMTQILYGCIYIWFNVTVSSDQFEEFGSTQGSPNVNLAIISYTCHWSQRQNHIGYNPKSVSNSVFGLLSDFAFSDWMRSENMFWHHTTV